MTSHEDFKAKMTQAIEHFKQDLKSIRTGRANPGMLDSVSVDVYGSQLRIRELANISAPEARQLLITPFDRQNIPFIVKAIEKANLGFMPHAEGNLIRIPIPPMDTAVREKMKKNVHEMAEKAKVVIRNIRRDANDHARKQKTDSKITEDMLKRIEKEVQEATDKCSKEIETLAQTKEKEVMTV